MLAHPLCYRPLHARNILILTAVRQETAAVQSAADARGVRVHTAGIGAQHLPTADQLAEVQLLLMCGLAGALDPALSVGDVVVDDRRQLIPADMSFRRGLIHTAGKIISSPEEKSALYASSGAAAVDMEQAVAVARLGIAVIGIRAISDSAAQVLDPRLIGFVDDLGRPKPLKIAAGLVRSPGLIPYLRELNRSTKIALANLGPAVAVVLDTLIPAAR